MDQDYLQRPSQALETALAKPWREVPCRLWTKASSHGYGYRWHQGRPVSAHRLSWLEHYGEIPAGLWVLHHCDTPGCYEINHLFLGTHRDNMADMARKGRARNSMAKTTPAQRAEITQRRQAGESATALAREFHLTPARIYQLGAAR